MEILKWKISEKARLALTVLKHFECFSGIECIKIFYPSLTGFSFSLPLSSYLTNIEYLEAGQGLSPPKSCHSSDPLEWNLLFSVFSQG